MREVVWMQSLRGRAIDLVNPRAAQIDFREIADSLANINRYNGASDKPVSVALHTLIAIDVAAPLAKPYVAAHDCHEYAIGDFITPCKDALRAIADEYQPGGRAFMSFVLSELARRHDDAIYEAAGLPLPSPAILSQVKQADLVALATERRDFMGPPPKPWDIDQLGIAPARRVYKWRPPVVVADELLAAFQTYFPALAPTKRVARRELAMA